MCAPRIRGNGRAHRCACLPPLEDISAAYIRGQAHEPSPDRATRYCLLSMRGHSVAPPCGDVTVYDWPRRVRHGLHERRKRSALLRLRVPPLALRGAPNLIGISGCPVCFARHYQSPLVPLVIMAKNVARAISTRHSQPPLVCGTKFALVTCAVPGKRYVHRVLEAG